MHVDDWGEQEEEVVEEMVVETMVVEEKRAGGELSCDERIKDSASSGRAGPCHGRCRWLGSGGWGCMVCTRCACARTCVSVRVRAQCVCPCLSAV